MSTPYIPLKLVSWEGEMNADAVTLELGMILVSGLASIFVLVLSLYRSLGVKSRVALAVVGDLLFSANLLLQQYHTYRDLERDNITCILDTQGTIVACTLVLAVLVMVLSFASISRAHRDMAG